MVIVIAKIPLMSVLGIPDLIEINTTLWEFHCCHQQQLRPHNWDEAIRAWAAPELSSTNLTLLQAPVRATLSSGGFRGKGNCWNPGHWEL